MRWLIVIGVLAVVVALSMLVDGTWKMSEAEYQRRIDARKKARAQKAAEAKR